MQTSLIGKKILITGAGSGIGQNIAQKLLEQGAQVYAVDINVDALQYLKSFAKTPEQLSCAYLNITDYDEWEKLFQTIITNWQSIDVVMNIAGICGKPHDIHDLTLDTINQMIDIDLKGVILGTRIAAKHMVPHRNGHIINFSSLACFVPLVRRSLYAACKAGVRSFSLSSALNLAQHNIKVTSVCLSGFDTPMLRSNLFYDECASEFSALADVNQLSDILINKVLPEAPLEVCILKRYALMAKWLSIFPSIRVLNFFERLAFKAGMKVQMKMRAEELKKKNNSENKP